MYKKWQSYWKDHKLFEFDEDSDRPSYVIDTPPPFTNGDLHMGQVFWICYIDAVAKYRRMRGFNVLHPSGWDAHGFPTEMAVEKKFGKSVKREEFYQRCVELSAENIKKMREAMSQLGVSFDEKREYVTSSKEYMSKVQQSMLTMHEKGMLYIGTHPVEWCVKCGTGISREETEEREEDTYLNYVEFGLTTGQAGESITIATTRPELLHACVAIAVNPNDKRYKKFIGSRATVPIFNNSVEIIGSEVVDKEYGTGAEMVCTFGDKRDILLFYRHGLKMIEAIDREGRLLNAGDFTGRKISEARAAILGALEKGKFLKKKEKIRHAIKVHDRDSTPVEFLSSKQWFIKIKEYADRIKRTSREIKWFPESAAQRLEDWADFIEWDWNVSRNRIFGTPIPFWHCQQCDYIVAPSAKDLPVDTYSAKPPVEKCPKCSGRIVGTEETLDVWVDSSITPLFISGWPNNKKLFRKAFPAAVRIQGTDIVRTWAFYTIFRVPAIAGDKPFENILVNNMILGSDGKEMHKSLGNGVSLEDLTSKYSIDAIRLWAALSGLIGKDKVFSHMDFEYAESFLTKLYNTARFMREAEKGTRVQKKEPHEHLGVFDIWILNRLNSVIGEVTKDYDSFALHEAARKVINFYWHEFADYYIENVKHRVYSKEPDREGSRVAALFTIKHVIDRSIMMLAPIIPFMCEEISEMLGYGSVFERGFPEYKERAERRSYVINGVIFASDLVEIDPESVGALLNNIISEVRKEKARSRLALNKTITSININVPEEYYSAVLSSTGELKQILKSKEIEVEKGKQFSVSIKA